jgi:hypothetical protein
MANEETLLDRLNSANDSYHDALSEIFEDKLLSVAVKTKLGQKAELIFAKMIEVKQYLEPFYGKS